MPSLGFLWIIVSDKFAGKEQERKKKERNKELVEKTMSVLAQRHKNTRKLRAKVEALATL